MHTVEAVSEEAPARRRLDRILAADYGVGIGEMGLDDIRTRRDDCLAEREFLSYLRRLLQGRIEILRAEESRRADGLPVDERPVEERLAEIFAQETPQGSSRGELLSVELPEEEMTQARRRLERVMANSAFSDPGTMSDEGLEQVIAHLEIEEREVSDTRRKVMDLHDAFLEEFKARMHTRLEQQGLTG